MFKSKFVFAVSFVALFAVGSAWAADSTADPDAGIAGVSYVERLLSDKQDKLAADDVKTTGETGVVKTVAVENEKLSVTKSAVATGDIADEAVTVAKTTGIYGYIPTKSDGSGAAQIWVE